MAIHNLLKVCSVLPALLIMPAMAETVTVNAGEVKEFGAVTISGNSNPADGGALVVAGVDKTQATGNEGADEIATAKINGTTFTGNTTGDSGGAIVAGPNSLLEINNATFKQNSGKQAGAIFTYSSTTAAAEAGGEYSTGGILKITGTTFEGNTAAESTGAVALMAKNSSITNSKFINNTAKDDAGALSLGALGQAYVNDVEFTGNKVTAGRGGAISTKGVTVDNTMAQLDILNSEFVGNTATTTGGAIDNYLYDSKTVEGAVYVFNTDFEQNSAAKGGAIYNHGVADKNGKFGIMQIVGGDFEKNTASGRGGAIYNEGRLTITGTAQDMVEFEQNSATGSGGAIAATGKTTIEYAEFEENKSGSYGGAIFAGEGAELTVKNSKFVKNSASRVGALSTGTEAKDVIIENTDFIDNEAEEVGAVGLYKNTHMTSVKFTGNKSLSTADDSDGAGAIFLGAESTTVIDGDSYFANNTSGAHGGVISMRGVKDGANTAAKLDILGTEKNAIEFTNNSAVTQGGAIFSTFYNNQDNINSVYIKHAVFTGNKAAEGGAIYNAGDPDLANNLASMMLENVTFNNNTATTAGGAIMIDGDGAVTLAGKNSFSGNKVGNVNNDIHNLGTLTVASGETTIGGGITGTGDINVADGAILNVGTTTVNATALTLDGTINATLQKNGRDGGTPVFAKLLADISGTGTLNLNISSVGEYKVFDGALGEDVTVNYGDIFNGDIKDGVVVVTTKSVAEIADDTGLTQNSAAIVSGLANSDNGSLAALSLRVQEELAKDNNAAYVDSELSKANPDAAPVEQSVAMSVQGQVMNLAAGRMNGGVVGRNGGDATSADYGMWAQGLFNKSKLDDAFHSYTRGFAIGADALIDKVWTVGVGAAFNSTDVHAKNARTTDIDTTSLFAYAQYKPNKWYVNATANYSMSDYAQKIEVLGLPFATDYDVDAFGGQLMTGYDFASGITPEVGVRYLHIDEIVADGELTRVGTDASDYLTAVAGMQYAFTLNTPIKNDTDMIVWRPELRAAATYDMLSEAGQSTVTMPGVNAYVLDGERLSRFGGEFGLGLTAIYHGLEISVNYELDLHEDYTSQTGMLKFRYSF